MKNYYNWYSRISGLAAITVISLQAVFYEYRDDLSILSTSKGTAIGLILDIAFALGIYTTLYHFSVSLFEKGGWRFFLRRIDITGKWYFESKVDYGNESYQTRRGIAIVSQSASEIVFSSFQFSERKDKDCIQLTSLTIWKSMFATINENGNIQIRYTAQRCDQNAADKRAHPIKQGVIDLETFPDSFGKPAVLVGAYTEFFPEYCKGEMIFSRNAEWKEAYKNTKYRSMIN